MTRSSIWQNAKAIPAVAILVILVGCASDQKRGAQAPVRAGGPCAIALAPHSGESGVDHEIAKLQGEIRAAKDSRRKLERLGWLFVAKARRSYDPGYYTLAEQSAACLQEKQPGSAAARLLRGHVLHSLHRFEEAEQVARELVATRESPFDYGLLGDALMEQGRLEEAAAAYQKMIDLKPGLQSFSRAAHLLWLKGDLKSATELMSRAARAGGPRNGESVAWAYARLAMYELQAGSTERALQACAVALDHHSDYAPALLARGRIWTAQGRTAEAVEALAQAAALNPLPEYQWALAEALREAGRAGEARRIEVQLKQRGAAEDRRTLSLYLATRGEDVDTALRLAELELTNRADVFTLDAVAWSLQAAGRVDQARSTMARALTPGTQDARLFLHAGVIAAAAGEHAEATRWLQKAHSLRQMLFPSEREHLAATRASVPG